MIFVVDANVVFSIMLTPHGKMGEVLFGLGDECIFLAPDFLKLEIIKHEPRIAKITKRPPDTISEIKHAIYRKLNFFPDTAVSSSIENHAVALLKEHDIKDIPYVALALFFQCKLWTGDKPLREALEAKGLHICISTQELLGGV